MHLTFARPAATRCAPLGGLKQMCHWWRGGQLTRCSYQGQGTFDWSNLVAPEPHTIKSSFSYKLGHDDYRGPFLCLTQGMFGAVTLISDIQYSMFKQNLKHVSWMKIISISPQFRVFSKPWDVHLSCAIGLFVAWSLFFSTTQSVIPQILFKDICGAVQSKNTKGVVKMLQKWLGDVLGSCRIVVARLASKY